MKIWALVLALGIAMSAHTVSAQPQAAQTGASAALTQLFADERAFVYRMDPLSATGDGVHDYDDKLPSVTPAAQAQWVAADQQFLQRLHAISRAQFSTQEQVSYDLFAFMVGQRVTLAHYNEWRTPLNSDSGFHADISQLASVNVLHTTRDYENYIARMRDIPRYFNENIANMRQGVHDGWVLPAAIMPGIQSAITAEQIDRAEDSAFWSPFAEFPQTVPEADRARLTTAGRAAILEAVKPAYADFQHFFQTEYAPHARATIGASSLPNGRAYYVDLVRYFTTLPDATPQQIHRIGLSEVARIRREMDQVIQDAHFQGSFSDFQHFLRTDPQFYPTTSDQLLHYAAWVTREIDAELPNYFGHLPRTPYTVKPVPAALAPNYTAGRANPGPIGSAGEYWVNIYALNTRPLYVIPALTLHEARPGHLLQIPIAREQTDVPVFRRNFYSNAFGEGWGLYSEKLGEEMGIYHTPYEHFGRLSYEMWRACRLVVDTGMHSMGWSRQRAIDYLTANTALTEHEIRTEIDRYIAWPGQALSYKMGELTIWRLRHHAEQALGARFDVRAFHDAVLENGGVTLPVLEGRIDAYIAAAQAH